MKLCVVGPDGDAFRQITEIFMRHLIKQIVLAENPELVISGACHKGGVDIYAVDEAAALGFPVKEYPPERKVWAPNGFKERNLKMIAEADKVICATLAELPADYVGKARGRCIHCDSESHVKSGGCWTMKHAKKHKKATDLYVLTNDGTFHVSSWR